jgi:hypothetical protein
MAVKNPIQFDIIPWDDTYNQASWKGVHTRGFITGGSVYVFIIPQDRPQIVYFDQDKPLSQSNKQKYFEDMNRPAHAGRGFADVLEWSAICMNTLDDHIESFDPTPQRDTANSLFHYVQVSTDMFRRQSRKKLTSQKPSVSEKTIQRMEDITLETYGSIYEEIFEDDGVRYWIINDPEGLLQELKDVKEHITGKKIIYH